MSFIHDDFLLDNETAKYLYHNHAKKMPIIDYHCHLSPKEIAEDKTFKNITEVWLGGKGFGDHYKWRLMRTNGVEERFITGNEPILKDLKNGQILLSTYLETHYITGLI